MEKFEVEKEVQEKKQDVAINGKKKQLGGVRTMPFILGETHLYVLINKLAPFIG